MVYSLAGTSLVARRSGRVRVCVCVRGQGYIYMCVMRCSDKCWFVCMSFVMHCLVISHEGLLCMCACTYIYAVNAYLTMWSRHTPLLGAMSLPHLMS